MSINPLVHALTVLSAPCSPYFLTSLLPACERYSSMPTNIVPFELAHVVMIYLGSTDMFFIWTFNWMVVFLGLTLAAENVEFATRYENLGKESQNF